MSASLNILYHPKSGDPNAVYFLYPIYDTEMHGILKEALISSLDFWIDEMKSDSEENPFSLGPVLSILTDIQRSLQELIAGGYLCVNIDHFLSEDLIILREKIKRDTQDADSKYLDGMNAIISHINSVNGVDKNEVH